MRFPTLRELMLTKLRNIEQAISDLNQEICFINNGEKYSNADLFSKKNWLDKCLVEFEEMHETACRFKEEYCSCGSGLVPNDINDNDETMCNECFNTPKVESNG